MNVVLWALAGAGIGWISYSALHLNGARGLVVSAIIGVGGAFIGGHVLTPMFEPSDVASGSSVLALLVASVSALSCAFLSDMLYERFGM